MQLWIQAPFRDASLLMNAETYGFKRIDGVLVPLINVFDNIFNSVVVGPKPG